MPFAKPATVAAIATASLAEPATTKPAVAVAAASVAVATASEPKPAAAEPEPSQPKPAAPEPGPSSSVTVATASLAEPAAWSSSRGQAADRGEQLWWLQPDVLHLQDLLERRGLQEQRRWLVPIRWDDL